MKLWVTQRRLREIVRHELEMAHIRRLQEKNDDISLRERTRRDLALDDIIRGKAAA